MAAPALSRSGLRRVLAVLCVTEIVSYGVLFYAFPVLAVDMAADTGWSTTGSLPCSSRPGPSWAWRWPGSSTRPRSRP